MNIRFGFSRPNHESILSTLIRKIEKREFSHVYVRFNEPSGKEMIFQASGLAVNLMLATRFDATVVEEYEITTPDIWSYVLEQLGKSYSITQLFKILLYKVTRIKLSSDGDGKDICSELAARLCVSLNMEVPGDLDYVTPSDFNKFCKQTMKRII